METNKTNSFTSASTIFSEVSIILFRKGIVLFNKGNIHEAHLTWEKIWKNILSTIILGRSELQYIGNFYS